PTPPPPSTWPAPASFMYGPSRSGTQLNATASVPGTFAYSPAVGTVLNAGSQSLSVTFTPTDAANYSTATATTTLSVTKASSAITWSTPPDIVYGTALDRKSTRLNSSH